MKRRLGARERRGSVALVLASALSAGMASSQEKTAEGAAEKYVGVERVWDRVKRSTSERALLRALEREALGVADERDEARIRVAVVDGSQGHFPSDARAVVLLAHYRLELSRARDPELPEWSRALAVALTQPVSPELRALAEFDRAWLDASSISTEELIARLDRVASRTLDLDLRARALVFRGVLHLRAGRFEIAREDFAASLGAAESSLLRGLGSLGNAWASWGQNRQEAARISVAAGAIWIDGAANVSGRSPWSLVPLTSEEEATFEALLWLGRLAVARERGDRARALELLESAPSISGAQPPSALRSWIEQERVRAVPSVDE